LERWKATDPHAPEGNWYKDFGSFLFCGTSELPKTILAEHAALWSGDRLGLKKAQPA
jgi:hypothetical protein